MWTWVATPTILSGQRPPVLVIGHRGPLLAALMLTSKDHDRDAADEARWGRHWMDVGTGDWDRQRRPSEVRLDRLIEVEPDKVRREGAALDEQTFNAVIAAARPYLTCAQSDGSARTWQRRSSGIGLRASNAPACVPEPLSRGPRR